MTELAAMRWLGKLSLFLTLSVVLTLVGYAIKGTVDAKWLEAVNWGGGYLQAVMIVMLWPGVLGLKRA